MRSRAPPTQKIIKISWCQKVRLVLRFHNRAPLYISIFNLERVIIKKLEKSRLFSSLFCPILAKSQRCLLNFAKLFYRFSSKTFFKKKAEIPRNKKVELSVLQLPLNVRIRQNNQRDPKIGVFVRSSSQNLAHAGVNILKIKSKYELLLVRAKHPHFEQNITLWTS